MSTTPIPTRMVYRAPGPHKLHGVMVDYTIIPENDIGPLEEGWHLTPTAAHEAYEAAKAAEQAEKDAADLAKIADDTEPPTREEMEAKARELGLRFDGRTTDAKLRKLIEAALQPN